MHGIIKIDTNRHYFEKYMKKVAILGTGAVGQKLASGFIQYGYEVVFGTAHPDKIVEWQNELLKNIPVLSYEKAVETGEIIVIAVKGTVAEDVVKRVSSYMDGKTSIDVTNPIADFPPENGVLKFFTDLNESLMERLQKIVPKANFVKAFNSVGNAFMVNPDFGGEKPTMFICGNNENARSEVFDILVMFGWDVEDMGSATAARAIEPLCILWCIPGFVRNEWSHALRLLRK